MRGDLAGGLLFGASRPQGVHDAPRESSQTHADDGRTGST